MSETNTVTTHALSGEDQEQSTLKTEQSKAEGKLLKTFFVAFYIYIQTL